MEINKIGCQGVDLTELMNLLSSIKVWIFLTVTSISHYGPTGLYTSKAGECLFTNNDFMFYRNNKVNKPTKTTTTTEETDSTTVTSVPRNNSSTPLGPLLNFTINRRITLRPTARDVQTSQQSSTPTSAADLPLGENPAARAAPDGDTDNNVVYVTAIGASNDQQAIAYVNMNAGFNADQISNDETTTKKVNDNPNIGLLYEDDLSTTIDITTSKITH
jgi:hypothetical protein